MHSFIRSNKGDGVLTIQVHLIYYHPSSQKKKVVTDEILMSPRLKLTPFVQSMTTLNFMRKDMHELNILPSECSDVFVCACVFVCVCVCVRTSQFCRIHLHRLMYV